MKEICEDIYDVAVIGGGPAGMMAAIRASENGARVVIVEKNKKPGKKLLITGGGRCNITNATFNDRELAKRYGDKWKYLLSPFSQFNSQDTVNFFESRFMPIVTEEENRMFPKSGSAKSVWDVLVDELKKYNVKIMTEAPVKGFIMESGKIKGVETNKGLVCARSFIVSTGGTSRPETGSSGDGFVWLKKIGHNIVTPDPALVPIKIAEPWVKKLQGLALNGVKITLIKNKVRGVSQIGKVLFTHFGLSGPLVLNMSRMIGEALKEGPVRLEIDLFPDMDRARLDKKLLSHFTLMQNKKWKNALFGFVPSRLSSVLVSMSGIDPEIFVNEISRASRIDLLILLKSLVVTPVGLLGPEKAIVCSGGVPLDEIDLKTMRSHIADNLYIVGDILDLHRPSGGFSLQICWTTGFIAGNSVSKK